MAVVQSFADHVQVKSASAETGCFAATDLAGAKHSSNAAFKKYAVNNASKLNT